MTAPVVTRFAPSPTGLLHVGGARTALYNWAFARRFGGTFVLRLEDTDRARSSAAAARGILADLAWLGLDWDEGPAPGAADPSAEDRGPHGPYSQSRRLALYDAAVERLLATGAAYEDEGAVRFRMPPVDLTVPDLVLGEVTVRAGEIADFIVRKGDGFPTYHLGVVVDDAAMGVTHVIRGQEHLGNTPKHCALQRALGLPAPAYAHIPLIFNPDGSKMSKRDKAKAARAAARAWMEARGADTAGLAAQVAARAAADPPVAGEAGDAVLAPPSAAALAAFLERASDDLAVAQAVAAALDLALPEIDVADFRAAGYLPGALCNYLALLGWNPGGDVERFDQAFLAAHFSLERVGKSSAKFDRAKLASFDQQAIAELAPGAWRAALFAFDARYAAAFGAAEEARFQAFAAAYQERSRTLADPARLGAFVLAPSAALAYDPAAVDKVLRKNDGEGFKALAAFRPALAALPAWRGEAILAAIEAFCAEQGLGLGKLAQPLRVATSGGTVTPAIQDTLLMLGREATLARIDRCLALGSAGQDGLS